MSSSSLSQTKRRISSVRATLKITSAMKVVSTAKLKTYRDKLGQGDSYLNSLNSVLAKIIANLDSFDDDNINSCSVGEKNLIILVSSSLGLCGAYNNNVFKLFQELYKDGDDVIAIGTKSESYLRYRKIPYNERFVHSFRAFDYSVSRSLGKFIIKEFRKRQYKKAILIGTKFINSLSFKAECKNILPVEVGEKNLSSTIIEPDAHSVYRTLLPQYVNSIIYNTLLNSIVCEYASRRNAMENASDNAENIIDELTLTYNKARQAAITQEITEVVSGANNNK